MTSRSNQSSGAAITWSARLGMVRVFAGWLRGQDVRTEVPPAGLIAGKLRRGRPYIYSDSEIATIVTRATKLPSRYGLRGWTCSTLFGLMPLLGCASTRRCSSTTTKSIWTPG